MIVAAVAATRTRPASIGVKDNAKGRGAVQLTVPDMDHCIGSRRSPANFRFARKDMPISVSNANKAITAWIILIPPKREVTRDFDVGNGVVGSWTALVVRARLSDGGLLGAVRMAVVSAIGVGNRNDLPLFSCIACPSP